MALSQIQCLDEHNVNMRTNETKPEFFYSEDQRLALEALLRDGRDAFDKYIHAHNVRRFLSDLELEHLTGTAEVYDPGSDHVKAKGEGNSDDVEPSLQYWPERSDCSIPDLDIGWPDFVSYRGVTRVNVYTQPPMEGQAHIKEIVRKTIVQAQKVIAVVMDLFTDVDIFIDLLDAAFKRKVAVYIILESTGVPHFLSMCRRAQMHKGHLKNLRVRSTRGAEFHTRSARKVFGSLAQKFMFVDGDRAVSGSYSYTWTASRLDRNLITVLTGQAVETFDKHFQDLYLVSQSVDLSEVDMEDEPEPEPITPPLPAPIPAAVARKRINPKYALVSSNLQESESKTDSEKNKGPVPKVLRPPREIPEPIQIHPGLLHLERINLIPYLPTWPEPDPPSDVIGFINIRDSSKPMHAHLMRSELFETSQAIRFKDPFVLPEQLPEKACPTQKHDPQLSQDQSSQHQEIQTEPGNRAQIVDEIGSPRTQNPKQIQSQFQGALDDPVSEGLEGKEPQHYGRNTKKGLKRLDQTGSIAALELEQTKSQQRGCVEDPRTKSETLNSTHILGEQETASPPVPKPRTIHLVLDAATCKEVSALKLSENHPGPLGVISDQAPHSTTKHDSVFSSATLSDGSETCLDRDDQKEKHAKMTSDEHRVNGSPRKGSAASTTSEEFFECVDNAGSGHLVNGAHAMSVPPEDDKILNGPQETSAVTQLLKDPQQEKDKRCISIDFHGDKMKREHASPHSTGSAIPSVQQDLEQGRTKSVDDGPRRSRRVVKTNRGKAGQSDYLSHNRVYYAHGNRTGDVSAQMANSQSFLYRLAQEQLVKPKTGRLSSQRRLSRRYPMAWGDSRASFGIPVASLSNFKHLKRKISSIPLETMRNSETVTKPSIQEQC
ncbi:protein FAM83G isoform X2 [Brienomyrus brachyistius]|uniref:protein FAM83G isoform X2 n=1 Tax=Brienomyrus brachyistius TaxID=42636 RepID=UPI0020B1CFD8|nr:protein FAM83G isoform X2 [Brienomyrus brachyistius]